MKANSLCLGLSVAMQPLSARVLVAAVLLSAHAAAYDPNMFVDNAGNMHINTSASLFLNGVDLRQWMDGCPLQPTATPQQPANGLYFPGATFNNAYTYMWRFDGAQIHPVPGIVSGDVNGVTQYGSRLVAMAKGTVRDPVRVLAFDGIRWATMAELQVGSAEQNCHATTFQEQLYVLCGSSTTTSQMHVRVWNSTGFTIVQSWPSTVNPTMQVVDNRLLVFPGWFSVQDRCFIRSYNGSAWTSITLQNDCWLPSMFFIPFDGPSAVLGFRDSPLVRNGTIQLYDRDGVVVETTWADVAVGTLPSGPLKAAGLVDGVLHIVTSSTSTGSVSFHRLVGKAWEPVITLRQLTAASFDGGYQRSAEYVPIVA